MNIYTLITNTTEMLLGWPLMIYVVGCGIICTLVLKGVQLTQFIRALQLLVPSRSIQTRTTGAMSPLQAFINTLSSNLGNGSIAGMATAIFAGGPGAAFWVVIFGMLLMAVRFAEVYISTLPWAHKENLRGLGGPMLYLQQVPGGTFLSWIYAVSCLLFGLTVGNAMQSNSIQLSVQTTWAISPFIVAAMLGIFVLYVVCGGAARILKVSDAIVPIKVLIFVLATLVLLVYHASSIWGALLLIITSAFKPVALSGGMMGFSVQQAIRYGMARSIMATESGLGTAAILFGASGSTNSFKSALMGMMSTFISTIVCFVVALCIIASGVWQSGLTSTALTIAAFATVFGHWGGWIVSFLSISFGIGVTIAYAFIVRSCWLFLTNGKYQWVFVLLYTGWAVLGALMEVHLIWAIGDIINAIMLLINLFGVVWLLVKMPKNSVRMSAA